MGKCWTLLQCILQHWFGDLKLPGVGITISDFSIRMFIGLRSKVSDIIQHRWHEFMSTDMNLNLPWTQQAEFSKTHPTNCFHESSVRSLRLLFHSESVAYKLLSMILKSGGFLFHAIHYQFSYKILLISMWSICWNAQMSSAVAETKFKPLSNLVILTLSLHPTCLLKLIMKESVLRECTTSMCIVLFERQVYWA